MYTIIVGYDDITEVYQLRDYNKEIKAAIECLNTYGSDSIEMVCEGAIVETMYDIKSIETMIKNFEDSEFLEAYMDESDAPTVDKYKKLLRSVALK